MLPHSVDLCGAFIPYYGLFLFDLLLGDLWVEIRTCIWQIVYCAHGMTMLCRIGISDVAMVLIMMSQWVMMLPWCSSWCHNELWCCYGVHYVTISYDIAMVFIMMSQWVMMLLWCSPWCHSELWCCHGLWFKQIYSFTV